MLALALAGQTASAQSLAAPPPSPASSTQPTRSSPLAVPPGSFLGGVPTGELTATVEKLTVVSAIQRALEHNLGVLTSEQNYGKAQGARTRVLSELLPNINGRVSETRQTINLAAFCFVIGSISPFGDIPLVIGPFHTTNAGLPAASAAPCRMPRRPSCATCPMTSITTMPRRH